MRVNHIPPKLQEALELFPDDKRGELSNEDLDRLSGGEYTLSINKNGVVIKVFDLLASDGTKLGVRAIYAKMPDGKQMSLAYENVVTNPECVLVLAMNKGGQFDSEVKFWGVGPLAMSEDTPCLLDEFCEPGIGHEFKGGSIDFDVSGTTVLIYEA